MIDGFHRTIDYLRLSVTDRCNLRCRYCMPPEGVPYISMQEILTYEEIERLCRIFAGMGIRKLKVTGGEPFVRRGICDLIDRLKQIPDIEKVTLTTNGLLIAPYLWRLKNMRIDGINFSLDTLNPDTFFSITGRHGHAAVMAAIDEALQLGIGNIKINCVPIRDVNDSEILALAALAIDRPIHVRFIEMMPIGSGRQFQAIPEDEILKRLEQAFGPATALDGVYGNGPAHYYHLPGFTGHIGFISAMSHRFCESCNRVRLTSDGHLKTCLFYHNGIDLKHYLRNGCNDEVIAGHIACALTAKPEHHDLQNEMPESKGMSQIGG